MHARIVRIVKNTPALVHFALIDTGTPKLEDHYVMLAGESGIHPYVIIRSPFGGEMRTMYRFDMDILDYAYSGERLGKQPKYGYLQSISEKGNAGDETWRLPTAPFTLNTTIASITRRPRRSGTWATVSACSSSPSAPNPTPAGRLRQELAVHQDALIFELHRRRPL